MGLLSWAKGVANRLIHKNEVENALRKETAISNEMAQAVRLWSDMYANNPPWKSKTVQTLNIPAVIATKIAKLTTIEAELAITGSKRAEYLQEQLSPIWDNIRNITEYAAAKGGILFKPYILDDNVRIDCVQGDRFFPVSYDSAGNLTGVICVAQMTVGKVTYTRLEEHKYSGGSYVITNKAFKSYNQGLLGSPCPLGEVEEWADIRPETTMTGLENPLFVYFKMPFANNIDDTSPLGVSIYSRAVETIEQLDRQYSRLLWEFEGGELAIHASEDLFQHERSLKGGRGRAKLPSGKERLYKMLDGLNDEGKNLFEVFAPQFRDNSILNGLNAFLKEIEQQCGLAFGTLSDPQSVDKTATEVIQSKQESYSTIADIQKALEHALRRLIDSVNALATAGGLVASGEYEVAFSWDDSIIVDKDSRRQMFWQYVSAGKFPFWRYLVQFEGFTEDEAKEAANETSQSMNLFNEEGQSNQDITNAGEIKSTVDEVAGKSLNGAQTQSLLAVMEQLSSGLLTQGQAINIISVSIGISKEEAKKIIEGLE